MRPKDEIWKPIIGYEGLYEVSNCGRVKSLYSRTRISDKNEKIMKQKLDTHGYYRVNLYKNAKCHGELVSRLVAMAFIDNPNDLPQVGHWDDNKVNNSVDNLYWTDAMENNHHNGKMQRFHDAHRKNIDIIARKLSVQVRGISMSDGTQVVFESMQSAEKKGFSSGKISMCVNGKRKTHKGYAWERI